MDKNETLSDESLLEIATLWDINRWNSECKHLSENQLTTLSPLADPFSERADWQEKLHTLFFHLRTPQGIEVFGKNLNSFQLLELIRHDSNDTALRQKFSSLFARITSKVFKELLLQITDEELFILREEAITEVIQHHLSLLLHELDERFTHLCNVLSAEEKELENINLKELDSKNILNLNHTIGKFYEEGSKILSLTNKALAIAWNTQRADFIQELGRIKELCQKYLNETFDETQETVDTGIGIRGILQKKIKELFSDIDPNGTLIPMKDSTPALEALVKFSIWNIQDYCDIGLLDLSQFTQTTPNEPLNIANLENRDKLFLEAETHLEKIGLKTLADLKSAQIYSKKALIDYISTHSHLF